MFFFLSESWDDLICQKIYSDVLRWLSSGILWCDTPLWGGVLKDKVLVIETIVHIL